MYHETRIDFKNILYHWFFKIIIDELNEVNMIAADKK